MTTPKTTTRKTTKRKTTKRKTTKRNKALRILVLRAPGTNCDRETAFVFEGAGAQAMPMHVNALLEKPKTLERVHGLVIPGGFSYGDDLGAGTVLGTILRTRLRARLGTGVSKAASRPWPALTPSVLVQCSVA